MSLRSLIGRLLVLASLATPAWSQDPAPQAGPDNGADAVPLPFDDAPSLSAETTPSPPPQSAPADPFDDLPPEAPRDEQILRVQIPGQPRAASPAPEAPEILRAAAQAPTPPLQSTPANLTAADPTVLPPERLTTGPTTAGITVEVRAPEVANVHLDTPFHVIIRNNGPTDAAGVLVRYPLPADLDFVDAEPAPTRADDGVYTWVLNPLPVGSERTIKVKVHPRAKKTFDHAVTVSLLTGGRARTIVRQPQLKVEIRADKPKPLKGTPVVFDIVVTNVGDLPARDVTVQARLSPGFSHPRGTDLILPLKDELGIASIAPGDTVPLKLEVETTGMGLQTCDITATSPDQPEEATAHGEVEVVHPDLVLSLEGPTERYPDNVATYKLTVTNNGTAPARQVVVAAQVPTGARPEAVNPRATWAKDVRTFYWRLNELPPKATEVFTVQARMGGIGLLTLRAGVKAEGIPPVSRSHNTEIRGISKLSLVVNEPRGVLDEGEESVYEIRIRNDGTADATRVQVRAQISDNLQILSLTGADARTPQSPPADPTTAVFPLIDRLPQGGEVTMSFRVKAVRPGNGTCEVSVLDDEIQIPIRQSMITRVTPASGPTN
jgi:uncharacterized repeat protein (TIGR01451 family)